MNPFNESIEKIDEAIEKTEVVFNKLAKVLEGLYKAKAVIEFLKQNQNKGIVIKDLESPFVDEEEKVITIKK